MIQHQRVTGEGENRLGLQRLRREFKNAPGTRSARRGASAARLTGAALTCADIVKQTNYDQNR
jgi:hypothetical protein